MVVKSEICEYLDLSIQGTNNRNIKVFPGMEYKFSFYDDTYGIKKVVIGLVDKVYEDQIKIICIDSKKDMVDCRNCRNIKCDRASKNHILPPMPICNCVLNPPDTSKYNGPKVYFIPLANLMDVSYVMNDNPANKPKPKGGAKVMILGISATVLKAIVVRLEFFDDNFEEAVKLVELEKDKIYDIAYDCKGTIYESRAKIVAIDECECTPIEDPNTPVRENVGMNNSVYNEACCHNKDDFMKEPPVRKIKITIDTSETFDGNLEVITLDSIRDCKLVEEESSDSVIEENTSIDTETTEDSNCNCDTIE